jgi:hypothetical protein
MHVPQHSGILKSFWFSGSTKQGLQIYKALQQMEDLNQAQKHKPKGDICLETFTLHRPHPVLVAILLTRKIQNCTCIPCKHHRHFQFQFPMLGTLHSTYSRNYNSAPTLRIRYNLAHQNKNRSLAFLITWTVMVSIGHCQIGRTETTKVATIW